MTKPLRLQCRVDLRLLCSSGLVLRDGLVGKFLRGDLLPKRLLAGLILHLRSGLCLRKVLCDCLVLGLGSLLAHPKLRQ